MPLGPLGQSGKTLLGLKPISVKIASLEILRYCVDCRERYGAVCKYCELDGTCSRHGIDFVGGKCPTCGRTFEEDWGEYIKWQGSRWNLKAVRTRNGRTILINPEDTSL